ncbi:hypothetical protein EPO04_00525 [Patescibacteria group bacterium]|nr:MAG: hypothetical protein EPO04_00525 [Patescibacteria group bacterium]
MGKKMIRRLIDNVLVHVFCTAAVEVCLEAYDGRAHPDYLGPLQARLLRPMTRLNLLVYEMNCSNERMEWSQAEFPYGNEELRRRLFDSSFWAKDLAFRVRLAFA